MTAAILPIILIFTAAVAEPAGQLRRVTLGQEFDLRVGERVSVEGEGLRLSLSSVGKDSRCPEGVTCVWQGNALVYVMADQPRRRPATLRLNTGINPKSGFYRGYEIRLARLEPPVRQGVRIRRRDYVATLVVTRR